VDDLCALIKIVCFTPDLRYGTFESIVLLPLIFEGITTGRFRIATALIYNVGFDHYQVFCCKFKCSLLPKTLDLHK
jgi:hypothetical protein